MSTAFGKVAIIVAVLLAIGGVLYLKGQPTHRTAPASASLPAQSERGDSSASLPATPPPSPTKPAPASNAVAPAVAPPATETANTVTPLVQPRPTPQATKTTAPVSAPAKPVKLPRLLELGADKCVPCKMMQPVLEELRKEYAGKLQVDFIDVWKDPAAGEPYNIRGIPTQIFFDADGHEVFRHSGFYPKDDIVAKFAELGITL